MRFVAKVDRASPELVRLPVAANPTVDRTLHLHSGGRHSAVVWSPGEARAAQISDLGAGAQIAFVCVESTNVGLGDGVTQASGEAQTLSVSLRVEPGR